MNFPCPVHSCYEYTRLLSKSLDLHEKLIRLKPGSSEYSSVLESLGIADQIKNRHLYSCGSNREDGRRGKRNSKKWAEVYSGH